jgi:hypothetical protein
VEVLSRKHLLPRYKSVQIKRTWGIPKADLEVIRKFPVGDLLRPGGWVLIGCRPCDVAETIDMVRGWGLEFGTLAFRRHSPYKVSGLAWHKVKHYILQEDLQEVVVIGFKPPLNLRGLDLFSTKLRPRMTNLPTRWEYNHYWKFSVVWGYPRLEIWGRSSESSPKDRWTRIGPHLDGMPIGQSLWLQHAMRHPVPLKMD